MLGARYSALQARLQILSVQSIRSGIAGIISIQRPESTTYSQIADAIRNHQPVDNVRRVIVQEDIKGNVINVDYDYYAKDDPEIGKTAFRTKTQM